METKSILVTGGAGFMGSWLVDELVERGHRVTAADSLLGGFKRNVNKDAVFVKADLRKRYLVERLVRRTDIIFHLAAYAAEGQSFFSPIEINENNLAPMNNLLVSAVNCSVERFVFTSSMAVYGEQNPPFSETLPRKPVDPYGIAKTYCERMLETFSRTYGFDYCIIRPHNVYGPRQNISDPYRNVLGIWMNRILRRKPPIIYGDGRQTRAFSYVADVTPAIANAGFLKRARSQIINVGSDEVVSINGAARTLLRITHSKLEPVHADARPGEVKYAFCTVGKSTRLLGYKTLHPLGSGLGLMLEWARKIGPQTPTYRIPLEIRKKAPKVWLNRLL